MQLTKPVILWSSDELSGAQTAYSFHESAKVDSAATATTANKLVDSAGSFVTNGVAVGDIVHNTTDDTWALVTAVDSATQLTLDTDIMADTENYKLYSGKGLKLQDNYDLLVVVLDVTADATDTGDKLDVYVDTSFEDGVDGTWVNIGHFTQHDGDGSPARYILAFKAQPPASQTSVYGTDLAESTSVQIGFGDRIRVRAKTTETNAAAFTFEVKAFLKKTA